MNEPGRDIRELEKLVLEQGDTIAYGELRVAFMDEPHGKFYKFAKTMADKFDYPVAYYDVYIQQLKPTCRPGSALSLDSCSFEAKNEAVAYLRKAAGKGIEYANSELDQLIEHGFIK